MPLELGKVSVFYLKRQMILTYFNEICEKPAEAGSTFPDLKMSWNQWNIPEILVCSFSPNKCNECQSVDANLDPDYILWSLKFCFINYNTGSCFAQYCTLSCRQPDNKYWRKENFKNQPDEPLSVKNLSKDIKPRGFCRQTLSSGLPEEHFLTDSFVWDDNASVVFCWRSQLCRQALWWIALPKL